MILLDIVAGLLFVLSSGLLFNDRFRKNIFLIFGAAIIALLSTYYLTVQIVDDIVARELAPRTTKQADVKPPVSQHEQFLVFFDYGSSDIKDMGRRVVDFAARKFITTDIFKCIAIGHSDGAEAAEFGADESLQGYDLSRRRALAVRAGLADAGMSVSHIAIDAVGNEKPMIKAGATAREPQNRFVLLDCSS